MILFQATAETLVSAIKEKRIQLGITQREISEVTGIAISQISRYEKGRSVPRAETLSKLAGALGASLEELIDQGSLVAR